METISLCDVCGKRDSFGCGHTGSQRYAARRHYATTKHIDGRCDCTQGVFDRGHLVDATPYVRNPRYM